MLHMNKSDRYRYIWEDLKTVYICRGSDSAHYIAGMRIGHEIAVGTNQAGLDALIKLFRAARHAD